MEILVCMKQVPDDSVEIHLGADGKPDLSQADPQGNAFDTYALELAVRYIEEHGGNVTVASVGSEDNKTCLKNSLAVGAVKAYLIPGAAAAEDTDAYVTAKLLADAIPKIEEANGAKFDMVFCGRESTDYIGSEVGEILAELLGMPVAMAADTVGPDAQAARVIRGDEHGVADATHLEHDRRAEEAKRREPRRPDEGDGPLSNGEPETPDSGGEHEQRAVHPQRQCL